MKTNINLLSDRDQKDIRLEKTGSLILNFFLWIFLSLIVLTLLLAATRFYLKSQLVKITDRIELQRQVVSSQENLRLKKQLDEFNAYLENLSTLDSHQARWSEAVINFARLVPVDVAIDTFVAERKTGKIRVIGFAKNRDSVLKLRKNLLSSDYFYNVNLPLTNLIKPTDVNFRYTFFVKEEFLLKNSLTGQ